MVKHSKKIALDPLPVVEALAPEFNFSHISKCLKGFKVLHRISLFHQLKFVNYP